MVTLPEKAFTACNSSFGNDDRMKIATAANTLQIYRRDTPFDPLPETLGVNVALVKTVERCLLFHLRSEIDTLVVIRRAILCRIAGARQWCTNACARQETA